MSQSFCLLDVLTCEQSHEVKWSAIALFHSISSESCGRINYTKLYLMNTRWKNFESHMFLVPSSTWAQAKLLKLSRLTRETDTQQIRNIKKFHKKKTSRVSSHLYDFAIRIRQRAKEEKKQLLELSRLNQSASIWWGIWRKNYEFSRKIFKTAPHVS